MLLTEYREEQDGTFFPRKISISVISSNPTRQNSCTDRRLDRNDLFWGVMNLRNLVVINDQTGGLGASEWIAGLSLFVAILALASTIWAVLAQIKHNRLSALPHVEIGIGTLDHVIMLHNHGPGVAQIMRFTAIFNGISYNLQDKNGPLRLSKALFADFREPRGTTFQVVQPGGYLAASSTSRTMCPEEPYHQADRDLLISRLAVLSVSVSTLGVYGDTHEVNYAGFDPMSEGQVIESPSWIIPAASKSHPK